MTPIALRSSLDSPDLVVPASGVPRVQSWPAAQVPGLELAFIETRDGFDALEADWNALHAEAAEPHQIFQAYDWCWHWCRHFLGGPRQTRLAIVTGRRQGRLVLVLPLVTQRTAGLTELGWLGEPVSQYGDILASPEVRDVVHLEAAWRCAVASARADVANLRRNRDDAVAAPLLRQIGAAITATEEAPYLSLANDLSFAAWETRRQPKGLKNRRRQARRLAELGPVDFASHSGSPEAAALAAHAIALKRAQLDAKGAVALSLADPRFEAFFVAVAASRERPSGLHAVALTSAGRPAAIKLILKGPATAFLHVVVFEPGYDKCAPGAQLLDRTVAETIEARRATLDLLPPRHEYKLDYADGVMLVRDHALALSVKGRLYATGFLAVRRRLKALVEALPPPVRRLVARIAR